MDITELLKEASFSQETLLSIIKDLDEENKFDQSVSAFISEVIDIIAKNVQGADVKARFDSISKSLDKIIKLSNPDMVQNQVGYDLRFKEMMNELRKEVFGLLDKPDWEYLPIDFDRAPYAEEGLGKLSENVIPMIEEITFITLSNYYDKILQTRDEYKNLPEIYLPLSMLKTYLGGDKIFQDLVGGRVSKDKILKNIELPGTSIVEVSRDLLPHSLITSESIEEESILCLKFERIWVAILAIMTLKYPWHDINSKFCRLLQNLRIARLMDRSKQLAAEKRTSILIAFIMASLYVGVPQFKFDVSQQSLKVDALRSIIKFAEFIYSSVLGFRYIKFNVKESQKWLRRLFTANRSKGYGLGGLYIDPTTGRIAVPNLAVPPLLLSEISNELITLVNNKPVISRILSTKAEEQRIQKTMTIE